MSTRTVQVSNVSLGATKKDINELFYFSGAIEYIELKSENERAQSAFVTFKEPQGAETAVLLSGAIIADQSVTITLQPDYVVPSAAHYPGIIASVIGHYMIQGHHADIIGDALLEYLNSYSLDQISEGDSAAIFEEILKSTMITKFSDGIHNLLVNEDVTKGHERFQIPVFGKLSSSTEPVLNDGYMYLKNNVPFSAAHFNFRTDVRAVDFCVLCDDKCGALCNCVKQSYGEVCAYNNDRLSPEFLAETLKARDPSTPKRFCGTRCLLGYSECEGHYPRPFIRECSICKCTKDCGNRVVQKGILAKIQVFSVEGTFGLRCATDLPEGSFLFELVGEVLTNTEMDSRNLENGGSEVHSFALDADFETEVAGNNDTLFNIDCTRMGNISCFLRSSETIANVVDVPVLIESSCRRYYHVAFFTKCDVQAFHELLWDSVPVDTDPGISSCFLEEAEDASTLRNRGAAGGFSDDSDE